MALNWKNKVDGVDICSAKDVNDLAAAIKENESGISGLQNDKVNKADVVNDLTAGGADKVLSAEQGKALKGMVDGNSTSISDLSDESTLPHKVKDVSNNKTFKMGLQIKNGKTQIVYEEAV
jgi:hypothetical protein